MKAKELTKISTKELEKILKDLRYEQVKASSIWGRERVEKKKAGVDVAGVTGQGTKTSLQRDIRKNIARVLTILNERKSKNE